MSTKTLTAEEAAAHQAAETGPFRTLGFSGEPVQLPRPARTMNEAWHSSVQRDPCCKAGVLNAFAAGVEAGIRIARREGNPFATTRSQA